MDALPGRYGLHLRPSLIAFCVGSVLVGAVALAEDIESGQPHVDTAAPADQGVEALLRQLERQITVGHTIAPEGDNALATWRSLLDVVSRASPPTDAASPATQRALTNFAADMKRRASEAQAAGRPVVASDLLVFADQATELLLLSTKPASSSAAKPPLAPAATVPDPSPAALPTGIAAQGVRRTEPPNGSAQSVAPAESRRSEIGQTQAGVPPSGSATTSGSVALGAVNQESMPPRSAAANTGAASADLASHPSVRTRTAQEQAAAAAFASRGDAMLAIKDISAARAFYEYAANAGSARAAVALAETYDPAFLNQLGALGPRPNPAMAADWYRKAVALGDRGADARLRTLGAEAAK
jgi:TPR repeat protein